MDRKALRRLYEETRRPMGVYRIRYLPTGRSLIGRSVDLPSVLNRERAQLRFGMHPNAELQRDWNEGGEEAFAFDVLDTLAPVEGQDHDPREDLLVLESIWRERLEQADEPLYGSRSARQG